VFVVGKKPLRRLPCFCGVESRGSRMKKKDIGGFGFALQSVTLERVTHRADEGIAVDRPLTK
jgi:hypothetical protein